MPRTILAHLNIELQDDDKRSVAEVEELIEGIIEVGQYESQQSMKIVVALAEEI